MTVAESAEVSFALLAVGLWAVVLLVALALTRPVRPEPGPAALDLGPEPPAVVNLLANRWTLTGDAAEATLLDLAARRFIELRQPGDDPVQTTVHLPAQPPSGELLRPYEKQVLDRIRGLATGGVVPLTALTFRDAAQASVWTKRLHAAVIAEARRLGLSRRRFGPTVSSLLLAAAAIGGIGVCVGTIGLQDWRGEASDVLALFLGLFAFVLFFGVGVRLNGERDTDAGRVAAARWLGVRDWLRAHDQFATVPPAGVMLGDRYLGFGAALGVTRVASMVLDLGVGSRKLIWSAYGGTWHRVKVRYPQFWPHYGRTGSSLVGTAAGFGIVGAAALVAGTLVVDGAWSNPLRVGASVVGLVVLLWALYVGFRALREGTNLAEVTGEVLWKQRWRSRSQGEDRPSIPWLYYLVVDDGTAEEIVAWGLPSEWESGCHEGDVVTVRAHRWTRRIVELEVVRRGERPPPVPEETGPADTQTFVADLLAADAPEVFSDADIAGLLGLPVTRRQDGRRVYYTPAAGGDPMAVVLTAAGDEAEALWKRGMGRNTRAMPDIGAGAYVDGPNAYVWHGEFVTALGLLGPGRQRDLYLPWLMEQLTDRGL